MPSMSPAEHLLTLFPQAPQHAVPLLKDGLKRGHWDQQAVLETTGKGLVASFFQRYSQDPGAHGRYTMLSHLLAISPKQWLEMTTNETWIQDSPPLAAEVLGAVADYQTALKNNKNLPRPAISLEKWFDDWVGLLPGLQMSPEQQCQCLQKSVQMNSEQGIEAFWVAEAFAENTPSGDLLRRSAKHSVDLWPRLLADGMADRDVDGRPLWLALLETAGENGRYSPTIQSIESWAFEEHRWDRLQGQNLERSVTWRMRVLAARLQSSTVDNQVLLTWLEHTPPEWTTIEELGVFATNKAQSLKHLLERHHALWEVPAHLGKANWLEDLRSHPRLGVGLTDEDLQAAAIRGLAHQLLEHASADSCNALVRALEQRSSQTPMPGLWRQAVGHQNTKPLPWGILNKMLKKHPVLLKAWQGDAGMEAEHFRQVLLKTLPKGGPDIAKLQGKLALIEQLGDHPYLLRAREIIGLLTSQKDRPPMNTNSWAALLKEDDQLRVAWERTARKPGKLRAAERAFADFQRALALEAHLPQSLNERSPQPRF